MHHGKPSSMLTLCFLAAWLKVEALLVRENQYAKQLEVLKADLACARGANRTESLAVLHDEALQEVYSLPLLSFYTCLQPDIARVIVRASAVTNDAPEMVAASIAIASYPNKRPCS